MFNVTCLTIFPEMFPGSLGYSLAGKALRSGIWNLQTINIRDFGITKHKNVDDEAYGGGQWSDNET
jgi:tRNA (guanine37-N1)-methyltransferase